MISLYSLCSESNCTDEIIRLLTSWREENYENGNYRESTVKSQLQQYESAKKNEKSFMQNPEHKIHNKE